MSMRDEWSVSCRDMAGRRRDLTIFVNNGRIVIIAPPGEAAVLAPLDVGRLRAVLRDAVVAVAEPQVTPQAGRLSPGAGLHRLH